MSADRTREQSHEQEGEGDDREHHANAEASTNALDDETSRAAAPLRVASNDAAGYAPSGCNPIVAATNAQGQTVALTRCNFRPSFSSSDATLDVSLS